MTGSLRRDSDLLSGVVNELVWIRFRADACAVMFSGKNNVEGSFFQHSRKLPLTFTNGEGLRGVVPREGDGCVCSFLVVVVVVFVFVESELAVGSAIDSQLDWIFRLLCGPFHLGSHGNDGTRANIERYAIDGRSGVNGFWSSEHFSAPEVVPFRFGKIEAAACGCRLRNRVHKKSGSVHELIANVDSAGIGAEVHDQRAHRSVGLAGCLPGERINVGKQTVAKAVEVDQNLLCVFSVRP